MSITHIFMYFSAEFGSQLSYNVLFLKPILLLATYTLYYGQLEHCVDTLTTVHNLSLPDKLVKCYL